jgi:hypothetical protein
MRAQVQESLKAITEQTKLHEQQLEQEWNERQPRALEEFQREEEGRQAEEV